MCWVLSFAAACGTLLGDVEIEPVTGVGSALPDAGTGEVPKAVICELATTRCEGRLLQLCTDGGTAWVTWQACATPALCEASDLSTVAACIRPKCGLEEMSCEGNELRLCNEDRTGWEQFDTCETAAHCDAGQRQCLPAPCEPGDRRCNLGNLERCRDDQTDWEQLDTCDTSELCEQTLAGTLPGTFEGGVAAQDPLPTAIAPMSDAEGPVECLAAKCLPREVTCDGVRLEACNEGQTDFELAEECATPALCEASITYTGLRGSPRCVRPTCAVGQHRCTPEGVLELCNDNRDGYRAIAECIGPQFCNSVAADNGQPGCEDAPCEAGEEQCNGPEIQRCLPDRTGFEPVEVCETRGLCNDDDPFNARCEPPVCQRGPLSGTEFRCQGATLQRCNDQHTGYDTLNTCATPGLCNAGLGFNGCVPPACAPGQRRCNGDFLQECNSQLTGFDNVERCAAGTCDSFAGRCADPCVVGSARCNGQGQLEQCRDRLIGWEITARCLSPQLCDAQARSCRQPPPGCIADGVRQCVRQGASTVLQVCTDGRSRFATLATCTGSQICDPNNNTCDVCDQNSQPTCQGNTLVTCSADGQSQRSDTCSQGCQTVANGPDRCRNCVLGSASCEGAQLAVCVARGTSDEFIERRACDSAGICRNTLATCSGQDCRCEPGVCEPGDRACEGNQPVICNVDRTDMVPNGPACLLASDCDGAPNGACFACRVGDVRCGPDNVMEGCAPDRRSFVDLPGARPGDARCISSNQGAFTQRCQGGTLVENRCESGICNPDGGGCAECNPGGFDDECTTLAGQPAVRVCSEAGSITVRPCDPPGSNPCVQTVCEGEGFCNTEAPRSRGAACTRQGGGAGFCDGAPSPQCVECVADAQCDDGDDCTTDTCRASGACDHTPSSGNSCRQPGGTGTCTVGVCVRCGDGTINGNEQCEGTDSEACPGAQVGSIDCVDCRRVNNCSAPPRCGDGTCTAPAGETTASCPEDCGSFCGDGAINGTEECEGTGSEECTGNQVGSIDCVDCRRVSNCSPPPPPPPVCPNGACEAGENGTNCPADCGPPPPVCPNGACEAGENGTNCPADCGPPPPVCPNGVCEAGENGTNCPADCGPPPASCGDQACNGTETAEDCPVDCAQAQSTDSIPGPDQDQGTNGPPGNRGNGRGADTPPGADSGNRGQNRDDSDD